MTALLAAGPAVAHELIVSETVQAAPDGSFSAPATFVVGPGPERLEYILLLAQGNADPIGIEYTYFCFNLLPEGTVENVSLDVTLVDPQQPAVVDTTAVTCGVSGEQTVFPGSTTVVPYEPQRPGAIYWTDSGGVYRSRLDGSAPQEVVSPLEANAQDAIAIDPLEGRLYWNSFEPELIAGVIRRARIHEGDPEIFFIGTKGGLRGVASDVPDRRLYIAEPSDCVPLCGALGRVKFDQSGLEELIALDIPDALAVAPALGRMCWSDVFNNTIECADLDGGNPSVLLSGVGARGLAIDEVDEVIYWSESSPPAIRRIALAGGAPLPEEVVTEGLSDPQGVAFDPIYRRLYWADRGSGKIQRVDPAGVLVEDVVTNLVAPEGIAIDWGQGELNLELDDGNLYWDPAGDATRFDVVRGDLHALRSSGGDYSTAAIGCAAEVAGAGTSFTETPATGEALFVLVRPVTSTGNGTYDSLGLGQAGARDTQIAASGGDCP
jgi:hypothetical protein